MARKQKVGLERSATRALLLEAAEQLMLEEGYMAVTSRRVGTKAGVRPQLVHYYFPSMDDLFVALFRHRSERGMQQAAAALQGEQPLRVIWQQGKESRDIALTLEFMALANHRKAIRSVLEQYGEQLRRLQHEALTRYFAQRGITPAIPAEVMSLLLSSVGIFLVLESQVGVTYAHEEAEAFIEATLRDFEAEPKAPAPRKTTKTTARKKVSSNNKITRRAT